MKAMPAYQLSTKEVLQLIFKFVGLARSLLLCLQTEHMTIILVMYLGESNGVDGPVVVAVIPYPHISTLHH